MSHLLCCCSSLAVVVCTTRAKAHQPTAGSAMHSGPKLPKTAKIKFTWCDFSFSADSHNFRFRSSCALHIQNLSNCCRNKYDPSIWRFFGGFSLFGPTVRQCHGVEVQAHHPSCTNARRTQGQGGISPNTPWRRQRRRPCAQPLRCATPTAGNAPYCHSTPWLASFVARRPLRPLPCRKGSYLSPCRLD